MKTRFFFILVFLSFEWAVAAAGVVLRVEVPRFRGNPGDLVRVPVLAENIGGVAGLQLQINYDPEVITLDAVTSGPLGQNFEMISDATKGTINITFIRAEALVSGQGRLAVLSFRINSGAGDGMFSDLAVANVRASDGRGVNLAWSKAPVKHNGELRVTTADNIDNDHDGLPDEWEEAQGLDPLDDHSKTKGPDGVTALLRYAFGIQAGERAAGNMPVVAATRHTDGKDYLTITFRRVPDASTVDYQVECSADLVKWIEATNLVGEPTLETDGAETVTYRDNLPMNGQAKRFMRVRVTPK